MPLTADQFAAATGCVHGLVLTWAKPVADACALQALLSSLPELYDARFDEREVSAKDAVWREIVRFIQR